MTYDFLNDAIFPQFRKFISDDYLPYQKIYETYYAPLADLSPANVYEWLDINQTLEVARLDDAIVFRYTNPFELNDTNYILLEPIVTKEHILQIYEYADAGVQCIMREQPRSLIKNLEADPTFLITPNRSSYEYILDTQQHTAVDGVEFSHIRYEVHAFERLHSLHSMKFEIKERVSDGDKALLLELLDRWPLTANPDNSLKDNREKEAIHKAIESLNYLPRSVALLSIDDQPAAFILFAIYNDTAIVGHVKVDYELPYIFDYVLHRFANEMNTRSISFINFEQDLGIEGLRAHKLRLRPVKLLEKVDIIPRTFQSGPIDS